MDRYFRWHDMSETKIIQFALMKLMGKLDNIEKNLKRIMRYRREDPMETWEGMKEKLKLKFHCSSVRN